MASEIVLSSNPYLSAMTKQKTKLHPPLVRGTVAAIQEIFGDGHYADKVIQRIFRENKKWGKRDRAFVAENVYEMVRWWRKLWFVGFGETDLNSFPIDNDISLIRLLGINLILKGVELPPWSEFKGLSPDKIFKKEKDAQKLQAIHQSIPDWLEKIAVEELGEKWSEELKALNRQAAVVLRANTLKTELPVLRQNLSDAGWESDETPLTPDALVLQKRGNIFANPLFKKGHFEVQDAGSQCIAPFLEAKPGMRVIDACAGAGGKTLHLGALMENRGSIIALDTEAWKLNELRRRAKRNGVHIVQTRPITSTKVIKRLAYSADRVLLDVPCSGLGVLRRNPDAKWKLSPESVQNVQNIQSTILEKYSRMLKPGGRLVYATCSILPSENEKQVEAFLMKNKDFKMVDEKRISPAEDGFDGFYMAALVSMKN